MDKGDIIIILALILGICIVVAYISPSGKIGRFAEDVKEKAEDIGEGFRYFGIKEIEDTNETDVITSGIRGIGGGSTTYKQNYLDIIYELPLKNGLYFTSNASDNFYKISYKQNVTTPSRHLYNIELVDKPNVFCVFPDEFVYGTENPNFLGEFYFHTNQYEGSFDIRKDLGEIGSGIFGLRIRE